MERSEIASGGVRMFDMDVDVSEAAGLGEPAHLRMTVALPPAAALPGRPIVCFAQPGAGYSRGYFAFDMPGETGGGQAGWHARRGWIFCALDPLGVGESTVPEPSRTMFAPVCAASHAAVQTVLGRLAAGDLAEGFPAIREPLVLGAGQSMGGCLTVVQQARHDSYDGIAVFGFSVVHTSSRVLPGAAPAPIPALSRDIVLPDLHALDLERWRAVAVNARLLELRRTAAYYSTAAATPPGWLYHFDDVPQEIVQRDLDFSGEPPPWRSATIPGLIRFVTAAGAIAPEAASIVVPVLSAFGERDVAEIPRDEIKAYRSAVDASLFICPRMGHMHNFASTREVLWTRFDAWGRHVAALKALLPQNWPARLFSEG